MTMPTLILTMPPAKPPAKKGEKAKQKRSNGASWKRAVARAVEPGAAFGVFGRLDCS